MEDDQSPRAASLRDRFLGCLLGLAIGDALGMPVEGWRRERIAATYGWIEGYLPRLDEQGRVVAPAGEFTDGTEMMLCHVESLISANAFIDPEGVGQRFLRLYHSDRRRFMGPTTLKALERAEQTGDFQYGASGPWPAGSGAAMRIAPIGLIHALGRFNPEVFTREVMRAGLITHNDPESLNGALAIAFAVRLLVTREMPPELLINEIVQFIDEDGVARKLRLAAKLARQSGQPDPQRDLANLAQIGTSSYAGDAVAAALYCFVSHPDSFRDAVLLAVNAGGDTDTIGAMTGALAGAYLGARQIPLGLVDGLEGRMYILVAAPGLYRAAQRRAGLFMKLLERE